MATAVNRFVSAAGLSSIELLLMVILLVGALYDFVVYMSATVSWKKIQITPAQKKLLRVQKG